jgi:hypothetical protein
MKKSYLLAGLALLATSTGFSQTKIGATGAPDPSAMLEVTAGAANNKGLLMPRMTIAQRNAITNPASGLMIYNTTTNQAQVNTGTPAIPIWTVATVTTTGWNITGNTGTTPATNFIGTADSQSLAIRTNNTEKLRVTPDGNVGIGNAAPSVKLQITDTGNVTMLIGTPNGNRGRIALGNGNHGLVRNLASSGGEANDIALYTTAGNALGASLYLVSDPTASNDSLPLNQFVLKETGNVGIGTGDPHNLLDLGTTIGSSITDPAGKKLALTNNASGNNFYGLGVSGSTLQFHAGSGTVGAPYMVLVSNGSVGIGINVPAYKLDVAGDINASGSVRSNGIALTSDARLKRNITNTQHGLSTVMSLRPVEYEKKNSIKENEYNHHEIGFIAQEIAKILPGLVTEGKDANKTLAVSYIELIPVLTRAIQEQQAQIETLKEKNDKLEANNKITVQLMERVKQMEQMMGIKEIEGTSKVAGK